MNAFECFKRLRNRLRKYEARSVVMRCIGELNREDAGTTQGLVRCPPWHVLLIIKWALLHSHLRIIGGRPFEHRDFARCMNEMRALGDTIDVSAGALLFFRRLAFQQFWLQEAYPKAALARQDLLFADRDAEWFAQRLRQKIQLDPAEFLDLASMTLTRFLDRKVKGVRREWYAPVEAQFSEDAVESFLRAVARDLAGARKVIEQQRRVSVEFEYHERTPLFRYPLLALGGEFVPYSRHLLFRAMQDGLYEILREDDPAGFMDRFGRKFERYVLRAVGVLSLPSHDEKELAEHLPRGSRCVDVLINDGDAAVYVDAKGVEMAYLGMVSQSADVVADKAKASVIKGIQQAWATAMGLQGTGLESARGSEAASRYLIVVTFRDLFLGSGRDFRDILNSGEREQLEVPEGSDPPIPFEHMYFVSIEDFDFLVSAVSRGEARLGGLLGTVVTADGRKETKKLMFRQHLDELCGKLTPPDYLEHAWDAMGNRCKARFPTT